MYGHTVEKSQLKGYNYNTLYTIGGIKMDRITQSMSKYSGWYRYRKSKMFWKERDDRIFALSKRKFDWISENR